ncbi:MAG: hypothetical protein QGH60_12665 [Phycisphaerae bacterium]|jgi:hypothetical protein|nr:hypothetical protein [Phycisphaerae bacterium]
MIDRKQVFVTLVVMLASAVAGCRNATTPAPGRPGISRPEPSQPKVPENTAAIDKCNAVMLETAREALKLTSVMVLNARLSPKLLADQQLWARRILDTEVRAAGTSKQKLASTAKYVKACEKSLAIIKVRRSLDASLFDLSSAEFHLAEARYFHTTILNDPNPTERKQAVGNMLTAAKKASETLTLMAESGFGGPGITDRQRLWGKRVMSSTLKLNETPERKIAAVRQYVDFCKKLLKYTRGRRLIDANRADIAIAELGVAEARYIQADPATLGGGQIITADMKQAARAMLAAIDTAMETLAVRARLRSVAMDSMAFLIRRRAETLLILAETSKQKVLVARQHVDVCRRMLDLAKIRFSGGNVARIQVVAARYHLAEAEYMLIKAGNDNIKPKQKTRKN